MKAYLKPLKIHEGQFSGEKGVRIANCNGKEVSGFFENEHIKNGKLEVIVISEKNDAVLVKLPGMTLEESGSNGYISVKREDLEYAA